MTGKQPWEMTAAELQAYYEACPEFAVKYDRVIGYQQPVSNYGMGHAMFIEMAKKAGKVIPPEVWAEANPPRNPEPVSARLQGPPR